MKQEQLAQASKEEAPEIPETHEELSVESVHELAESKETALDALKERSSQETAVFEKSFTESAQSLGATPEEITPVTGQIEQLEVQKEHAVEDAHQQIENTTRIEALQEVQQPLSPESVAPHGQEAANEPDLEAFAKAQDEKARSVIDQISSMSGEEAAAFAAEYNKNNPDSLKGQELRLMRSEGDTMFIVNERGSLEQVAVN